jgi:hypothetical protein
MWAGFHLGLVSGRSSAWVHPGASRASRRTLAAVVTLWARPWDALEMPPADLRDVYVPRIIVSSCYLWLSHTGRFSHGLLVGDRIPDSAQRQENADDVENVDQTILTVAES